MVHSTWGEWFIHDEVEATQPDGLSVWYLGCNGFIVRSPHATVYIDPYFGEGNPPTLVRMIPVPMDPADATRCDAVLVTHEHIDHMHPPSYGPFVNDLGAELYAPSAAYGEPDYEGSLEAPDSSRHTVAPGLDFTIEDLDIHVRGANDPDAIEPVSYVIEHESGTLFHGGDTRPADTFSALAEEFAIDLGILPLGTVGTIYHEADARARPTRWYMDENQVIEAANALQLERLVPSHFDMWKGVTADPKSLTEHAASYAYPRVIDRVTVGDRLDLERPGIVPPRHLR